MDQLKFIATKLSELGKQGITAISLHDDLSIPILISFLSDISTSIITQAQANTRHYSPPDLSKETFEESLERLAHFLNMLNFEKAGDVYVIFANI
jgi:hypothetical protein